MGAHSADVVAALVRQFEERADRINAKEYKEANVRQDFLDPLFSALGWNTADSREVQHERAVRIDDETKSVDIAFRLPNRVAFVLEAKRPTARIAGNAEFAFQARRYGWNASVPFAILSNFGETVVYDSTTRPKHSDSANVSLVESWTPRELVEKWPTFEGHFGKAAVVGGALEQWSGKVRGKQKRISVDESLLDDIETWRLKLAKSVIARNELEAHQLAEVVQLLLDRILFLRICEDRGLETPRRLAGLLDAGKIYERLKRLLALADQKYNAGLFYLEDERGRGPADAVSASLRVDDDVLREVIGGLYDKNRPYNFSVIPTEILGQVYEQFLGTVLRVTASGDRVKAEFKPEVKEAGGVFYTPSYIVDRIVRTTVAPLLEGKGPPEVAALRILDPACGSGSFLLGAYQFLLNWHHDWYLKDGPKKHTREMVEVGKGQWILSVDERKRILRNNIFGVDIDRQATEVTKLSLFLKVVEETAGRALESNQKLFEDRVLPSMERNIKCGNSLIEPGQVPQQSFDGADMQTARRVNAFSWRQAFESIMAKGGFDAIVGNPPYIRIQALNKFAPLEAKLYKERFRTASKGNADIYVAFVEQSLGLLGTKGRMGMIVPNKFLRTDYGSNLRQLIAEKRCLEGLINFGHSQVFSGATTYTCLLFLSAEPRDSFLAAEVAADPTSLSTLQLLEVSSSRLSEPEWTMGTDLERAIEAKLDAQSVALGALPSRIGRGSSTGADDVFMLIANGSQFRTRSGEAVDIEAGILRIPVYATDFGRYAFAPKGEERVIFPYVVSPDGYALIEEAEMRRRFPKALAYLRSRRKELDERKQFNSWYGFSAPRNLDVHEGAAYLVPLLARQGSYCSLESSPGMYCLMASGGFSITPSLGGGVSPLFILGLLNSGLLFWKLRRISNVFRGGWITCTKQYVEQLPIRMPNLKNPREASIHDRIVVCVRALIDMNSDLRRTTATSDLELIQRHIESKEAELEECVFTLYGLTADECLVVRAAAASGTP